MRSALLFLLLVIPFLSHGQKAVFHTGKISSYQPIAVNSGWLYKKGDDARGADPKLNDSSWTVTDTRLVSDSIAPGTFDGIGWFRLWIVVDSAMVNQPLSLVADHSGASEIYLNGSLLHRFGNVSSRAEDEIRWLPNEIPIAFSVPRCGPHLLAVRYSNHAPSKSYDSRGVQTIGFTMRLYDFDSHMSGFVSFNELYLSLLCISACMFFVFALMHLLLYLAYKAKRSNYYFFLFALSISLVFISLMVNDLSHDPAIAGWANLGKVFFLPFVFFTLHLLVYSFFRNKLPKLVWISAALSLLILIGLWVMPQASIILFLLGLAPFVAVDVIRNIIIAVRKKLRGAWIIGTGMGLFALFFITLSILLLSAMIYGGSMSLSGDSVLGILLIVLFSLGLISIPLSMSIYLARDFAHTNKSLEEKLEEVETLSAKSIEQEKEKQRMLENQNVVLEQQVRERTSEISEQKKIIEEKSKDITDSINYAQRIQRAMLPGAGLIRKIFPQSFLLFQPKDIVSGDFYWFGEKDDYAFAILADCTGHGVPGAMMSMIGFNLLEQIIVEKQVLVPGDILQALHEGVRLALRQQGDSDTRDGMDVAIIRYDRKNNVIAFAGANRPLWLIDAQGKLTDIKGDKKSIGGLQTEDLRTFRTETIPPEPGSLLVMTSDGFADQFGGSEGKKFMTGRFKELLVRLQTLDMPGKETALLQALNDWKQDREQVDDICVIGIRF